jgi:hypothetical protein
LILLTKKLSNVQLCKNKERASGRGRRPARPVTPRKPQAVRCARQNNIELMAEKEILDFKPALRLE